MKKIFLSVVSLMLILALSCFSGCAKAEDESTTLPPLQNDAGDNLYIRTDSDTVAPGGEFTVTVGIKGLINIACMDCYVIFDGEKLTASSYEELEVDNFDSFVNESQGRLMYSGFTAKTINFEEADCFAVTFKVPENAAAGEEYTITAHMDQMLEGTDADGVQTNDIATSINDASITVTVK